MLYAFSLFPLVSSLALVTSAPSTSSASDCFIPAPAVTPTDTGAADTNPILLTPALATSYAAVEKALAAYWAAHPDKAKVENEHGHAVNITYTDRDHQYTTGFSIPDYPAVVRQDTAVAAIFAKYAFSSAQYQPVEQSVRNAITAVIKQQKPDSSVGGRNMAFVQQHRPELAADWSEVQTAVDLAKGFMQNFGNIGRNIQNRQGQGSDLDP